MSNQKIYYPKYSKVYDGYNTCFNCIFFKNNEYILSYDDNKKYNLVKINDEKLIIKENDEYYFIINHNYDTITIFSNKNKFTLIFNNANNSIRQIEKKYYCDSSKTDEHNKLNTFYKIVKNKKGYTIPYFINSGIYYKKRLLIEPTDDFKKNYEDCKYVLLDLNINTNIYYPRYYFIIIDDKKILMKSVTNCKKKFELMFVLNENDNDENENEEEKYNENENENENEEEKYNEEVNEEANEIKNKNIIYFKNNEFSIDDKKLFIDVNENFTIILKNTNYVFKLSLDDQKYKNINLPYFYAINVKYEKYGDVFEIEYESINNIMVLYNNIINEIVILLNNLIEKINNKIKIHDNESTLNFIINEKNELHIYHKKTTEQLLKCNKMLLF